MLSSISQPLRAHSSTTSAARSVYGPSGFSRNPPCGFQLLESPLPFLVLFVTQDCVQYLGRVRVQLGPFFASFWIKLLVHHHLTRHCKALFKLVDYLRPKLVLVTLLRVGKQTSPHRASRPVVQEFSRTPAITGDRFLRLQASAGCGIVSCCRY